MIKSEEYWNNKYVKREVIYACRVIRNTNTTVEIDVRNFISPNDAVLQRYINQYGLKKETHNETAHACQKFIAENFKYAGDDVSSGVPEFWMHPYETILCRESGSDCEDQSILLTSLLLNCGVPSYRAKCAAGYVKQSPTAPTSGHCYTCYLADREEGNQEWIVLDTCYFQDSELKCEDKPLLKDGGYNNCYGEIWWSFNDQLSWSNEEVVIDSSRVKSI